jgi:hypothetical protein
MCLMFTYYREVLLKPRRFWPAYCGPSLERHPDCLIFCILLSPSTHTQTRCVVRSLPHLLFINNNKIRKYRPIIVGRNSSVGMATCNELEGPGLNPGESEIFRTRPGRSWGPPSLQYNRHRVLFPGVKRPGCGVNHPNLSPRLKKEWS